MYVKIKVPVYIYGKVETTGSYNLPPIYKSQDPLIRNLPITTGNNHYY